MRQIQRLIARSAGARRPLTGPRAPSFVSVAAALLLALGCGNKDEEQSLQTLQVGMTTAVEPIYDDGEMELVVPAPVAEEQLEQAQRLAVEAFVATDCEGMARADMFVREDGEVLVNELNTIPGFTPTSVYARLFEASGIAYAELLQQLADLAVERFERRSGLRY